MSAEGVGGSPVGGRSGVLRVGGTGEGPPECVWGGVPRAGAKVPGLLSPPWEEELVGV